MADYPITAVARRVVYSGSAGTGPYNFSFPVITSTDIDVYKDSTKLTLTTDYTVTVSATDGTGSVTLDSAATSDNTITIVGARALQRTTDFVTAGDLLANSLNTELDSQTIFVQQASEDATRAVKAPVYDPTSIDMTLPAKADRAGKLMGFHSSTGNPEATTGRVNSIAVTTVTPTNGAAGSATASFVTSTGVLTLGIPQGSTGIGGVGMQYSTTTTDSDPGAGFIRFNNTSLNSATIMYVDDSDGSVDISAWVQSWDNSTSGSKGFITITGNPNASSPLVIFKVNGAVTDASGYTKIPVAYVAGSTSISNAAEISVQFSPAGDGDVAGLDYTFSTTTSDADPGAGVLRLNHSSLGSASAAYIDDSDANGADVSAYILTWDDSTNTADRGQLYITKKSAPANFAIYKISGASTDASGYVKLAITHVDSNGSFSNTDPIAIEFNRTGNKGTDGTMAGPGSSTDNAITRFNGTSGETVQNSGVTLDDSNHMSFPDDAKVQFGAGNDLQIYHDASNSYINDAGTGNLKIAASQIDLLGGTDGGETMATFVDNGAATLYHDNSAKIATSATGVSITGTLLATTDTDTSNTGSVTLDFAANQNFVLTLTGNVTLANPSTEQVGQAGVIVCIQDGTGSRTLSLGTDYETAGGAGITLSTAGGAVDVIPYFVKASGSIQLGAVQLAFS